MVYVLLIGTQYFNSQPHKEADHENYEKEPLLEHFNSQPHKEADYPTQLDSKR